ncbi:hypothetical protein BJ138DRAFT_1002622, partial [Hygrophoropsis aurantiaca]
DWIKKLGAFLNKTAGESPQVELVGICFGHQIISHAVFGLNIHAASKGWEIGPHTVQLTPDGKKIFPHHDTLKLEMFHHDAANVFGGDHIEYFEALVEVQPYKVAEHDFHIRGSTLKAPNQGTVAMKNKGADALLETKDIHIFTCQGHPEITPGMTAYLLDLFEADIVKMGDQKAVAEARGLFATFANGKPEDKIVDWLPVATLMWALTTGNSFTIESNHQLHVKIQDIPDPKDNVFVLLT